jgi:hypothetical protein
LTGKKDPNDIDKKVYFILCPSCFWCASYFNFGEMTIVSCPMCHSNRIDQLPVSIDKAWLYWLCMAQGGKTKCDKCGVTIEGGRRKLNQHKRECHSYWPYYIINQRFFLKIAWYFLVF